MVFSILPEWSKLCGDIFLSCSSFGRWEHNAATVGVVGSECPAIYAIIMHQHKMIYIENYMEVLPHKEESIPQKSPSLTWWSQLIDHDLELQRSKGLTSPSHAGDRGSVLQIDWSAEQFVQSLSGFQRCTEFASRKEISPCVVGHNVSQEALQSPQADLWYHAWEGQRRRWRLWGKTSSFLWVSFSTYIFDLLFAGREFFTAYSSHFRGHRVAYIAATSRI